MEFFSAGPFVPPSALPTLSYLERLFFFMFGLSALLSYDKKALLYRIRQQSNRAAS